MEFASFYKSSMPLSSFILYIFFCSIMDEKVGGWLIEAEQIRLDGDRLELVCRHGERPLRPPRRYSTSIELDMYAN